MSPFLLARPACLETRAFQGLLIPQQRPNRWKWHFSKLRLFSPRLREKNGKIWQKFVHFHFLKGISLRGKITWWSLPLASTNLGWSRDLGSYLQVLWGTSHWHRCEGRSGWLWHTPCSCCLPCGAHWVVCLSRQWIRSASIKNNL